MLPLDLILGFNHDEGLEAIVALLMDPTNDTNFAQVFIDLSRIQKVHTSLGEGYLGQSRALQAF